MVASLVAAIRFLTRIPIPGRPTRGEDLAPAVGWFPLVGAGVGLATAGAYLLALRLWPATVAAVLAVAFGLLVTGGFHEDGATDATDGLGAGGTRERMVEIMRDSRIGAYGSMALWAQLTFRWAALVALGPRAILVLPLAMVWGRWSIAVVLALLPPAAPGLASQVGRPQNRRPLLLATGLLALANLAAAALGLGALWKPAAAAGIAVLAWAAYLKRRMGGHTGDLLGAGNQVVEAAAILALLAR